MWPKTEKPGWICSGQHEPSPDNNMDGKGVSSDIINIKYHNSKGLYNINTTTSRNFPAKSGIIVIFKRVLKNPGGTEKA